MHNCEFVCAKATAQDDIGSIAGYLYLTDPYIYPALCDAPNHPDWITFIKNCTRRPGNLYHLDHLSVIRYKGIIAGAACVIPCGTPLTLTEGIAVPPLLQQRLPAVMEGYFAPLLQDCLTLEGYAIVNLCIDSRYHGMGLGARLLAYCIEQCGAQPIHLDVITANHSAHHLYEKAGFSISHTYSGFSGDGTALPCYHMIRTADPT